ncbi:MAG TPA: alpha/beta fold hydrolase [Anaerolineales bacterium]|jgi:carboxylesterase
MNQIIPTAEPFFFPGSKTGILLVHGFTGAPKEMRRMGVYLHDEHDFTVLGVRLSGHATHPEDMIRSSYGDWLASVEDGFALLSNTVDNVIIMGLSMGGVLSLATAAYLPVKAVVAMSTTYRLPDDPRLRHIEWLSKMVAFMPKSSGEPDSGWFDKQAYKGHVSYPQNPLHAIGELYKLTAVMQAALPKISVPVLLMHSRDDDYVVKDSMPLIYEHLTTADKQMLWLEGSGHVITEDAQCMTVFTRAAEFAHRVIA